VAPALLGRAEIQSAAEEVAGRFEELLVSVAAGSTLGHDLAVQHLGRGVDNPMAAVGRDVVRVGPQGLSRLLHRRDLLSHGLGAPLAQKPPSPSWAHLIP